MEVTGLSNNGLHGLLALVYVCVLRGGVFVGEHVCNTEGQGGVWRVVILIS